MQRQARFDAQENLLDETGKTLWDQMFRGYGGERNESRDENGVIIAKRYKTPFQRIATWDMKPTAIQLVIEFILGTELPYYVAYAAGVTFFEHFQYRFDILEAPFVETSNDEHIREGAQWAKKITDYLPTFAKNCVNRSIKMKDRKAHWCNIAVSCEALRGRPKYQEDRYICLPSLELHASDVDQTVSFLGVLDGHGGAQMASYVAGRLPFELIAGMKAHPGDNEKALEYAFTMTDKLAEARSTVEGWHNIGSTAVAAVIDAENIYLRWLGDSAAYVIYGDRVERLTRAHNCMDEEERERVIAAGGSITHVDGVQRVNGQIAITRAFGDMFHRPAITGVADAKKVARTPEMYGIMLVSDGICDLFNPLQLWKMIETFVCENDADEYYELSEHMTRRSFEVGSSDNCTCVVGFLQHPRELWKELKQDVSTTASSEADRNSADSSADDS